MSRGEIVSGMVLAGRGVFIVTEAAGWKYLGPDGTGPGFFSLVVWFGDDRAFGSTGGAEPEGGAGCRSLTVSVLLEIRQERMWQAQV